MKKIYECEKNMKLQVCLGSKLHSMYNLPYKSLPLRFWHASYTGILYPAKEGISLKETDWQELLQYLKMMYSERLELYSFIPCLTQPKAG